MRLSRDLRNDARALLALGHDPAAIAEALDVGQRTISDLQRHEPDPDAVNRARMALQLLAAERGEHISATSDEKRTFIDGLYAPADGFFG